MRFQRSGVIIGDCTGTHCLQIVFLRRWLRNKARIYHSPWRSMLRTGPWKYVKGYADDWFSANTFDFHPRFTSPLFPPCLTMEPTTSSSDSPSPGVHRGLSLVFLDVFVKLRKDGGGVHFRPYSKPMTASLFHVNNFTHANSCYPRRSRLAILTGAFIAIYRRSCVPRDFIKAAANLASYLIRRQRWLRKEVMLTWRAFTLRLKHNPVAWLPNTPNRLFSYTTLFRNSLPRRA